MNNIEAAIKQVEEAIASIDLEIANTPLDWNDREGTRNLRVKMMNTRRLSLLIALEHLKASL